MGHRVIGRQETSAVAERVGRDVDDSHDLHATTLSGDTGRADLTRRARSARLPGISCTQGGIVAKILLRSARDPFDVIEAGDPRAWGIGFYGTNVGNLLFAGQHGARLELDERTGDF